MLSSGDMSGTTPELLRLSVDVNSACDLNCGHCRHASQGAGHGELTNEDISRIVDDASRLRVFRLTFSGGEPLLRHDMIDILLGALRSGVGRVFLSTNGRHLGDHDLRPLLPFRRRLTFKISLDGPEPVHDRLRGRIGAGAGAKLAIEELIAMGFDVQGTTTLRRENLMAIGELVAWTAEAGCSRHHFVEVVPVGRAVPNMVLERAERRAAMRRIREAASKYARRHFAVLARLPFVEGETRAGLRCLGGTEECGILADGSVVACRLVPDLVECNVKHSSLREIWSSPNAFGLFRGSQWERLKGPCSTCENGPACRGGCRAFARGLTGDLWAPDPRCSRVLTSSKSRGIRPC